MSATHSWFAAVAVKSRSTRPRRVSGPSPASVIRRPFSRVIPRSPSAGISRCPVQRATETPSRRRSRTSFSSSASRCASPVVVPGWWPSSISACRTPVRNVSGWSPSRSPTRRNAPGLVGWIQPRGHSHPRGPFPELVGVFLRCWHGAHPPVGSQPPPDPGRFTGDELWQDPPHHRVPARSSGLDR